MIAVGVMVASGAYDVRMVCEMVADGGMLLVCL